MRPKARTRSCPNFNTRELNKIIDDSLPPTFHYQLTSQLTYHSSHVTTLALIKRGPILDSLTPLATQLHFLNLFGGDETPYESLHSVVSHGVKPWFDAFVGSRSSGRDGGDSKMGQYASLVAVQIS